MSDDQQAQRIQDVTFIMKDLLKVIKVVSMYPEDNPLPQSLRRTFAERLEGIVADYGDIVVRVHKSTLEYDNTDVFADKSKEERLAGLFFDTGVTSFTLKAGLDVEEIYKLLDVLKAYVNSPSKDNDLVAMIWEANISRFKVTTLEDIALAEYDGDIQINEMFINAGGVSADGVQMSPDELASYNAIFQSHTTMGGRRDDDSDVSDPDAKRVAGGSLAGAGTGQSFYAVGTGQGDHVFSDTGVDSVSSHVAEAAEAMGLSDLPAAAPGERPDTTLILNDELRLSEEEEQYIENLCREDAAFDMYESTAELLREMLHQETDLEGFNETVTICEKVTSEFIKAGKLIHAGQVIAYFQQLEEQIKSERPKWSERLRDARVTIASRDRLRTFVDALNLHMEEIGKADLRRYLDLFDWQAVGPLTDVLGDVEHEHHRDTLCDFLAERGRSNPDIIAKGVYDKRTHVVCNTITVLCRLGDAKALGHLKKVVNHKEHAVRRSLVTGLRECADSAALELLKQAVRDPEAEIRKAAVGSIVARRGPTAFDTIADIISDDMFERLEPEDQKEVLCAYSVLGGDQAVEYLVSLADRMNMFNERSIEHLREAAFDALSLNRSSRCEKALLKLSSSWRGGVKFLAVEALKKRRERIYGGDDEPGNE